MPYLPAPTEVTMKEAALMLGVEVSIVSRYLNRPPASMKGEIKARRVGRRAVFIDRASLLEFAALNSILLRTI